MALYSIAIHSAADELAAIKTVRAFSGRSIEHIRGHLGTEHSVITIDTTAYGIELEPTEGHKQQHAIIRGVIEQLKAAGCEIVLRYQVTADDMQDAITEAELENLFAAELTYLEQERD